MDESKRQRLMEERRVGADRREASQLRSNFGPQLADVVARNSGVRVRLEDFQAADGVPGRPPLWTGPVSTAEGLVKSASDAKSILDLLRHIGNKLGLLNGRVSFEGADYLGEAFVERFPAEALLPIAEESERTVVLRVAVPAGILAVDFFPDVSTTYSLIVHGPELRHVVDEWFAASCGK